MFDAFPDISPSQIQEIGDKLLDQKGIRLSIKRDDLIHPEISGNKWRKLKHNVLEAKRQGKKYLVSYGGAFSNHIYALAAVGKLLKISTIGIIRGEASAANNVTLQFAKSCGMKLYFVDRQSYKDKIAALKVLEESIEQSYIIPEGGTNRFAMLGCEEIITETDAKPDYWCVCCGTGGTITGMIAALKGTSQVLGFSALKGTFLTGEVQQFLQQHYQREYTNWQINTDYHFGGYARYKQPLIDFINQFKEQHNVALDPIYTGKMFYGLYDLIQKDYFPPNSHIMAIHTGGLQGIAGFNQRYNNIIST